MCVPTELSFDEILKFMLLHNGRVTNHELVKHFKAFLTNPDMRDEARNTFKKHVNTLANIKNHNNEKWLILKKKYTSNGISDASCDERAPSAFNSRAEPSCDTERSNLEPIPYRHPPPPFALNQDLNLAQFMLESQHSLVTTPSDVKENVSPQFKLDDTPPKAYPRRKSSSDKISSLENKPLTCGSQTSLTREASQDSSTNMDVMSPSRSEISLDDNEHKISVKERKQMFNRMASEGDVNMKPQPISNNFYNQSVDEDDRASIRSLDHKGESDPLDPKQKAWILCAARGEYHALAKMCSENAKLAKTKDPFTTAMHWACKRGDENLVKLLAGVARGLVNARSGYTPLHIAMQFRHENVYRLLVDVYDADSNMRDWSGKKPQQYLVNIDTSMSPGSFRMLDKNDLRRTMTTPPSIRVSYTNVNNAQPKKESFLRIGSLNVRVKKTTEAFSNFLGVGATRSSGYVPKTPRVDERGEGDQLHKNWGSVDNIPKDDKLMPPPLSSKVRRRAATGRKGVAHHSRSTPSTPDQPRARLGSNEDDSDSDSAAGFHAAWRQQRASDCL